MFKGHCEICPNTEFFLVRIFPHSDWIWRDAKYISVFSSNARKYGPEKNLCIWTLFTQWELHYLNLYPAMSTLNRLRSGLMTSRKVYIDILVWWRSCYSKTNFSLFWYHLDVIVFKLFCFFSVCSESLCFGTFTAVIKTTPDPVIENFLSKILYKIEQFFRFIGRGKCSVILGEKGKMH